MLVIRLQRTGRKGHAMFRVVVQDSRKSPTSGKVVAWLGNYDPHAKVVNIDKEKATLYLTNGAQPSERIARLLKAEGVKLPDWVSIASDKQRVVRNADKRRSTKPPEPKQEEAPVPAEAAEAEAIETPIKPAESTENQEPVVDTQAENDVAVPEESKEITETEDKTEKSSPSKE